VKDSERACDELSPQDRTHSPSPSRTLHPSRTKTSPRPNARVEASPNGNATDPSSIPAPGRMHLQQQLASEVALVPPADSLLSNPPSLPSRVSFPIRVCRSGDAILPSGGMPTPRGAGCARNDEPQRENGSRRTLWRIETHCGTIPCLGAFALRGNSTTWRRCSSREESSRPLAFFLNHLT
jgi:hypothetical protein